MISKNKNNAANYTMIRLCYVTQTKTYPPSFHPLDVYPGLMQQLLDMLVWVGALQEHGFSERG